ncbi:unnamed protein product [Ixodes hexagonus]
MLPLLGLTWIPGFLLLDNSSISVVMTYVFCVLNTLQIRLRRSSTGDERGSSSTVTSDSRVIATIFGKRGSLSFNTADAAAWDLMAGKFTSTIAMHRHPHHCPPSAD